jgi:hypothetical protein
MFGAEPAVVKPDYAKWMLDDPRINFAISRRGGAAGVNHLGFQVDEAAELTQMHARLQAADAGVVEERNVSCCYANSDKYWVTDPAGVAWETFHSLGTVPFYGSAGAAAAKVDACCAPTQVAQEKSACCG